MEERSEAALVAASTGGDRRAYSELIGAHARHVYAICLAMVHNAADAKDLSQESLIRGFLRISSLRDRERFGPWIAAIAVNLCRDHLRRRPKEAPDIPEAAAARRTDSERILDLRRMLHRLPEEHLLPLLMYYYDGRSVRSVADMLGISPEAVYMRLSRARRELRRLLEEGENDHAR